jgi:hypothetical protein
MNGLMVFLLVYVSLDIVLTILFCIKVKRCGNSLTDLAFTLRSFVTKYEYHHYDDIDNIEEVEYEDITNINDNE